MRPLTLKSKTSLPRHYQAESLHPPQQSLPHMHSAPHRNPALGRREMAARAVRRMQRQAEQSPGVPVSLEGGFQEVSLTPMPCISSAQSLIVISGWRKTRKPEPRKPTRATAPVSHQRAAAARYIARTNLQLSLVRLVVAVRASIMVYRGMMGILALSKYSTYPYPLFPALLCIESQN